MGRVYNRAGRARLPKWFAWKTGASASGEPFIDQTNSQARGRFSLRSYAADLRARQIVVPGIIWILDNGNTSA